MIAEVKVEFSSLPTNAQVYFSEVYNNWVDSQPVKYYKLPSEGEKYSCIIINRSQIKQILHSYFTDKTKTYNTHLEDTDFIHANKCLVM